MSNNCEIPEDSLERNKMHKKSKQLVWDMIQP